MSVASAVRGLRRAELITSDPAGVIDFHQGVLGWVALETDVGFDCWVGNRRCATIRPGKAGEVPGWRLIFAGAAQDSSLTGPDDAHAAMARGRAQHGPLAPGPRGGEPCWVELSAADAQRADEFWTDMLRWTVEPDGTYCFNGRPVANRTSTRRLDEQWGWLCYFAVDALDPVEAKVDERGGKVLERVRHPVLGEAVLIMDPQGAVCAVTLAKSWGGNHRPA